MWTWTKKRAYLPNSKVANALHRATQNHIDDSKILLEDGIVGQAVSASSGSGDTISFASRGGSIRASERIIRARRLSIGSSGLLETCHRTLSKQRNGGNEERINQLILRMPRS